MTFIPYNKDNNIFARQLRKSSTKGEVLLWNILKAKKMRGYAFNRQKPIGDYIADFYCKQLNLVIEIDGKSHSFTEVEEKDRKKQSAFECFGLTVLRFKEKAVVFQRPMIIQSIEAYIEMFESGEKVDLA